MVADPENPIAESRQLILISSPYWGSSVGTIQLFEKTGRNSKWKSLLPPREIALSENGLGWGTGLHGSPGVRLPLMKKGDGRSPAGAYRIVGVSLKIQPGMNGEYKLPVFPSHARECEPRLFFGIQKYSLVGTENREVPLSLPPSQLKSIALWLDEKLFPVIVLLPAVARDTLRMWGIPRR